MALDIGWIGPILSAAGFILFLVALAIFKVFWNWFWGDHDDMG